MSDWIRTRDKLPAAGEPVEVKGSDWAGDWTATAWWVPYKGRPPKGSRRHGRWMYRLEGKIERLGGYGEVDYWRPLQKEGTAA